MAEENSSEVKEIEKCVDTNPPVMSEESSVETVLIKDVEDVTSVVVSKGQEECISETNEVTPKPQVPNVRRHSTGTIGTRAGKLQVQSRYRGNHHVASTHDFCKHGGNKKKCDQDDAVKVKPWKMVRRKSAEGSCESVRVETSSLIARKSLSREIPVITKPESSLAAKRDVLAVKKKTCASVKSESSSVKDDGEKSISVDGSSVKSNDKARKKKETESALIGSAVVKKVSEKSNSAMKKASKISDAENSDKVSVPKNKEKARTQSQTVSGEDVKEKTVCVVESSVKGVQSEKQPSTMGSGQKSLTASKQNPGKISTGLTKKKLSVAEDLEANPKTEKKIRANKKTGVKVTQANQLSFKRGKVIDPKSEDSSPRWIKFRRRVMQEQKPQTEGRKKKVLKEVVETKSDACEGSKREKVLLKHRKVEGKKKMITLFNSVIEETFNNLTKVRKHKVKALIGAFETVISLQDAKTHEKIQSKATTSASQVSPLVSEQ